MTDDDYAMGELDRRLANILRVGTVTQVDAAKGLARVDLGELETDWLPWQTSRAGGDRYWTTPDVGEQVTVVSPGDPSQGVIMGSLFQDAHPQNGSDGKDRRMSFQDGSVVEFDRTGSRLNVTVQPAGSITLNIGGTMLKLEAGKTTLTTPQLVVDSPQSTFTGKVSVQGLLTYLAGMSGSGGSGGASATINGPVRVTGGDITTDGDVKAGNITLKGHSHMEQGDGKPTSAAQP